MDFFNRSRPSGFWSVPLSPVRLLFLLPNMRFTLPSPSDTLEQTQTLHLRNRKVPMNVAHVNGARHICGPSDLAVLGVTTVSYYLVCDLVKRRGARKLVGAAVLATGTAVAALRSRTPSGGPSSASAAASAESSRRDQAVRDATGHGDSGRISAGPGPESSLSDFTPRKIVTVTVVGAATALLGAWIVDRVDRVAVDVIRRLGGRLPVVGRVVHRFPSATWGLLQFGTVVAVELATTPTIPTPQATPTTPTPQATPVTPVTGKGGVR